MIGIDSDVCVKAALIWAGMSSGPLIACTTHSIPSGTRRAKNSCRSARTSGSAFSWISSEHEVWRTNSVSRPVSTPLSRTKSETMGVNSVSPGPSLRIVRLVCLLLPGALTSPSPYAPLFARGQHPDRAHHVIILMLEDMAMDHVEPFEAIPFHRNPGDMIERRERHILRTVLDGRRGNRTIHVEIALQRRERPGIAIGDVILDPVLAEGDALDDAVADQMHVDGMRFIGQIDQVPDLGIAQMRLDRDRGVEALVFEEKLEALRIVEGDVTRHRGRSRKPLGLALLCARIGRDAARIGLRDAFADPKLHQMRQFRIAGAGTLLALRAEA